MESSRCQAIFFIAKAVSVDCTGLFVVCAALSGDRGDLLGASGDMDGPRGLYSKLASWFAC